MIIILYFMFILDSQPGLNLDKYFHPKEAAMKAMGLALQPRIIVITDNHERLGFND
jgi:hypothetical protein